MENIYQDIAQRSGGDVYIGVVGPVRTGKSTFIKNFMDMFVLPKIENPYERSRAQDELPQSAAGRTIMTTEPKFIPNEAVEISLPGAVRFKVRLIDCVGYIVDSALGHIENDQPRMVHTPWSSEEIPFAEAAEIGTKKVICDHSTVGIVVTTDGSVTDIPREDYLSAEERVIKELQAINKPFVILLNSADPYSEATQDLARSMEEKYGTSVTSANCADLNEEDIGLLIESLLYEFPVKEIGINIPGWIDALPGDHYLKSSLFASIRGGMNNVQRIRDVSAISDGLLDNEYVKSAYIDTIDLGTGTVLVNAVTEEDLFYRVLGETTGLDIRDEASLMQTIQSLADAKRQYDKVQYALESVKNTGYGIVSPTIEEMQLEEPEIVKQGGRYGVRLRASAPSIHMMCANIRTEVSPIVGTERQSEELVHYLLNEFENDPAKIWESNIFGKSLHDLVNEGLNNKLSHMPAESQGKLRDTLEKIINEGSGGLICIIL